MYDDSYYNGEEFKELLRKYESATPGFLDADDLVDIAEYYTIKRDFIKTIAALDYAIRLFPSATGPLLYRARICMFVENNAEKAEGYMKLVDDKLDADYCYLKAEMMIAQDEVDGSDKYLEECLNAIDTEERDDFALDVATIYLDNEFTDLAQKWARRVDDKDTLDYKEVVGRIAMSKGNYKESERVFNELVNEDPFSGYYWNQLASSQFNSNDAKGALDSSDFSMAINPNDPEAILNKANALAHLGNTDEAVRLYEKLTLLCPDDYTGEMYWGIMLSRENDVEGTICHLKKAAKLAKNQPMDLSILYQTLAYAYSTIDNRKESLAYINRARKLLGGDTEELLVLRGNLYLRGGDILKAEKTFLKALDMCDNSADMTLRVALSMYDAGYVESAYAMLKGMLHDAGDDWKDGFAYLASCCVELGKHDEFEVAIKTACERNSNEVRLLFGDVLSNDLVPDEYYDYLTKKLE